MFAIRQAMQRNLAYASRQFATAAPKNPLIPKIYSQPEWRIMLSDPSTYPILLILGFATAFAAGMSGHALLTYKNLRILPSQKHQVIPTPEHTRREPLAEKWSQHPHAMNAEGFKSIRYEGLGVDHEEWLKLRAEKRD